MNDFDNCECDIFSPCEHHYRAKPLDDVTYDAVQLEMLRWQLMKWKKKHSALLVVIENERKEKEQLSLDVTTWQARFLALTAKFLNLKNVIKELDLWFSAKEEDEDI